MDAAVREYLDAIDPGQRPLFDRIHRLILGAFPDAELVLAYGMPTYRTGGGRLHVGVWRHGVSLYGWDARSAAALLARRPGLRTGKGTIRLSSADAGDIGDDELLDVVRGALGG